MSRQSTPHDEPGQPDRPLSSNDDLVSWVARFRAALTNSSTAARRASTPTTEAAPSAIVDAVTHLLERVDEAIEQQSTRLEKQQQRLAECERGLADLRERVARDAATINHLTSSQTRLEALLLANERQRPLRDTVDATLDRARIADAVHQAMTRAEVEGDPSTHLYLTDLLPRDFYDLLIEAMPPPPCFRYADPTKQDFEPHSATLIPDLSRIVWTFFEDEVVEKILTPAILTKFHPFVRSHYEAVFGPEFADEAMRWPQRSKGRLMLRRPGYSLAPHLDPKKVLLTFLIYFARTGDSEEHGTRLYRVNRPFQASSLKTYYPEQHGYRCELTRTIPFRPNTGFAFINGNGAHGASIPPDSNQTERYAYQFYVAPPGSVFADLVRRLPPERQALFEGLELHPSS